MKCDLKKIEQCPLKLKNLNLGDPSFTISFSDMSRQPPAQMLFLDHFHLTYMLCVFTTVIKCARCFAWHSL